MDAGRTDILHLAEPLVGVADTGHSGVGAFLSGLGDRLANLARCDTPDDLIATLATGRPDYVLLGDPVAVPHLMDIRAAMRTATLGVVILGPPMPHAAPVPQIEVETLGRDADPGTFALRLRALMRRCRPVALSGRCQAGGLMLDEAAMTLAMGPVSTPLSREDFRLLGPLFDLPRRIWSREDLLHLAYGAQTANGLRTIDVKLNRTRRRLRAALGRDPIRSVRGMGYRLDVD